MGKQKKRKLVPAALHSEISEYASLLRVLRATDMLDVTAQLTRLGSSPSSWHATPQEAGRHEATSSQEVSNTFAESLGHPAAFDPSQMSRKTWTRWPLLAEDLHIPEWRFEDEVHSLAKQALLSNISNQFPPNTSSELCSVDCNGPNEDQIEALLPPASLRTMADVSSSHLEHILSAVASYSPLVDNSVQHRRHPIRWESVLNIVSATGLVDGNIVRNVKSRLEAIYGSHPDPSDITSVIPELPAMVSLHDLDNANFFDGKLPGKRRKRRSYKKHGQKASIAPKHPRAVPFAEDDT